MFNPSKSYFNPDKPIYEQLKEAILNHPNLNPQTIASHAGVDSVIFDPDTRREKLQAILGEDGELEKTLKTLKNCSIKVKIKRLEESFLVEISVDGISASVEDTKPGMPLSTSGKFLLSFRFSSSGKWLRRLSKAFFQSQGGYNMGFSVPLSTGATEKLAILLLEYVDTLVAACAKNLTDKNTYQSN